MSIHINYIERERFGGETEILVCNTKACGLQAQLALSLLERWGLIATEPDGEDSAGRQRMKLLGVADMVTRACDTAEAMYAEFEKRDWLLALPLPKNSAA